GFVIFFFQAEDGIRDRNVTGVQTCALPISGMTGVEAAKQILKSASQPPLFVFTTAYDAYAIDAFEIEAIDYLLKPFDQVRLHQRSEERRVGKECRSVGAAENGKYN